jgi:hypothetical protein
MARRRVGLELPEFRRRTLEVLCQPTLPIHMRAAVHRLPIHPELVNARLESIDCRVVKRQPSGDLPCALAFWLDFSKQRR